MDFLLDPNVAYLFLLAGVLLGLMAIISPGTGIFEVGAFFCLALAGYAVYNLSFNLWALIFGFRDLSTWLQARFGGPYQLADREWTSSGLLLLGWFAAAVAISLYPVLKPKTSGSVVVLPILIGLVGMTNISSSYWLVYGAEGMARNRAIICASSTAPKRSSGVRRLNSVTTGCR